MMVIDYYHCLKISFDLKNAIIYFECCRLCILFIWKAYESRVNLNHVMNEIRTKKVLMLSIVTVGVMDLPFFYSNDFYCIGWEKMSA